MGRWSERAWVLSAVSRLSPRVTCMASQTGSISQLIVALRWAHVVGTTQVGPNSTVTACLTNRGSLGAQGAAQHTPAAKTFHVQATVTTIDCFH
jgi:hypothetical protein